MGNLLTPSWKGKLERGEVLPPDLELTEEILRKIGIAKRKSRVVLQNLQRQERETWGNLLDLVKEGEKRLRSEVGDDVAATRVWNFFNGGVVSKDVTTSVLNSLLQDLGELPSLDDLNSMFSQPMKASIPVPTWLSEALFIKAPVDQATSTFKGTVGCVRASDTERTTLEGVFHNLLDLDVKKKVFGRTDIFFQQLLGKLLDFKAVTAEINRNATEGPDKIVTVRSGTKRSRTVNSGSRKKSKSISGQGIPSASLLPDLLVYIKKLLFLRGEEKRLGVPLKEAEDDLKQKTLWCPAVMGRLPYTLAYAACGEKFQLYAIHPLPSTNVVTLMKIGRELDLTNIYDALELVVWVTYIARIMARANAEIVNIDVPPIGTVWERVSGQYCKITIHETYVEKCLLENDGNRIRWKGEGGLKQLYDLIRTDKITGTIRLNRVLRLSDLETNGEVAITLLLGPLGYRVIPLLHELRDFLNDVLAALHSMHVNGWVHRDVKLKNIVKRPDGHWMLIDLEYAAKLDETGSSEWPWFDRAGYPMPKRMGNERWRPEHDVKQVAIMLEQLAYFKKHPSQLDIINILMEAKAANIMDRLRPFLN